MSKNTIAKYPKVNDDEIFEGLLIDAKPNQTVTEINVEEFNEVINKVAKDIYEKEWKK